MTPQDKATRRPPWIVLGIGAALLAAAMVFPLIPDQTCPQCHGFTIAHNEKTIRGLPDASGVTPCTRCEGRSTVSRLNLWLKGGEAGD